MNCPELELLERFLKEDLSGPEHSRMQTHLDGCPACSDRLADLSKNERLLEAIDRVAPNMDSPYGSPRPESIPGFTLLRQIGRGGMAVVFEAQQLEPRRRVALKILSGAQFLDPHRATHLRKEARALARLKHPGIAAVHDAGSTPDGQYFFALELIDGQPLTEFVRENQLDVRDRLRIFEIVCEAVAHAHQRGVIHRDIKPSNILVDRNGQPKLLDFGLARITDTDVTITTVVSEIGKIQGTLPYMSPEQTRGDPAEIDLRSDVYSLGVLLFELLTDRLPYTVDRLLLPEAVRVICEEQPQKPSTVNRTLRGDLETIVLKALQKEPDRRYQSVESLRDDIRRYLAHQPILARPPSATYRFRKLVARHRVPFALTCLLVSSLIGFSIGMAYLYGQSQDALTQVRDSQVFADKKAQTTEKALDYLVSVFQLSDPLHEKGETATVRELLDANAVRIVNELEGEPEIQLPLLRAAASVYRHLGLDRQAADLLKNAFALDGPGEGSAISRIEWAGLHHLYGRVLDHLSRLDEAEQELQQARAIYEEEGIAESMEYGQVLRNLSYVYSDQDRFDEAIALLEQCGDLIKRIEPNDGLALAGVQTDLATVYTVTGKLEIAERLFRSALAINRVELGNKSLEVATSLTNLGTLLNKLGRYAEALEVFDECLASNRAIYGDEHPAVARILANIGVVYCGMGKLELGVESLRSSLAMREKLLGLENDNTVHSMLQLAQTLSRIGEEEEARKLYKRAIAARREIYGNDHSAVARALTYLGEHYSARGEHAKAVPLLEEALEILEKVVGKDHPGVAGTLAVLAGSVGQERAISLLERALALTERQFDEDSPKLVSILRNLGLRYKRAGRLDEALPIVRRALDIQRAQEPQNEEQISSTLTILGVILVEAKRFADAETALREAYDIRQRVFKDDYWLTANTASVLGGCLTQMGRFDEAKELLEGSLPVLETVLPKGDWRIREAKERLSVLRAKRQAPTHTVAREE